MTARLAWNGYGKAAVRLVKVDRLAQRHELHDLTIEVQLQGDFGPAHAGDNTQVLPTDTMKNTVYALGGRARWNRRKSLANGWPDISSAPVPLRGALWSNSPSTDGTGRKWATPSRSTPLSRGRPSAGWRPSRWTRRGSQWRRGSTDWACSRRPTRPSLIFFAMDTPRSRKPTSAFSRLPWRHDGPTRVRSAITPRRGALLAPVSSSHSPGTNRRRYSTPCMLWVKRPWRAAGKSGRSGSSYPIGTIF